MRVMERATFNAQGRGQSCGSALARGGHRRRLGRAGRDAGRLCRRRRISGHGATAATRASGGAVAGKQSQQGQAGKTGKGGGDEASNS